MRDSREPWIAWPGWAHVRLALLLAGAHLAWFGLIYGGCDWITSLRPDRWRLNFQWELAIPLVPALTLAYMSIYVPMILAPFVLRRRRELIVLVAAMCTTTLCAGVCFLLFPAQLAYAEPRDLGVWAGIYWFARHMALRYNLMPSLHVALSSLCLGALGRHARTPGRLLLAAWALLIAAATLLIHAHHVVDVVTGWALAGCVYRFVFLRWAPSAASPPSGGGAGSGGKLLTGALTRSGISDE